MTFPLYVLCGYPSYAQRKGVTWRKDDWRAMVLVKAAKGKPFNTTAVLNGITIANNSVGKNNARAIAGKFMAQKLRQNGITAGHLVPIPASNHVTFGTPFIGSLLADQIVHNSPDFTSSPVLRFRDVMTKSSEGGSRSPEVIEAAIDIQLGHGLTRCILVDDVTSTHGHIKGAARALLKAGITVDAAICIAQTYNEPPATMFSIDPQEIDAEPGYGHLFI